MPLQRYLFSIVKSQKDTTFQDLQEKFDIRQLARTSTQKAAFPGGLFSFRAGGETLRSRSFLCFIRGVAPNVPRGSRASSLGPPSAVRAGALI